MEAIGKLREDIQKELEDVEFIIGWEQGFDALHATPLFIRSQEDIDRLIWNPLCVHNLASYLPQLKGRKVGVLLKGCDSRSVIQLLQEGLIQREEIVIFGISCPGVVDLSKIRARMNVSQVKRVSFAEGNVTIETPQGREEFPLDEVLATKCLSCQYPTPLIYDHLAGEALSPQRPADLLYKEVEEIEKLDVKERLAHWERELNRCIRCYACRNACPLCVCQDYCAADSRNPHWLSQRAGIGEKVMWHIMHALHVAGRCTDCGECERACPMDIPIQRIRKKINKEIKALFDYEAGVNTEDTPPLYTFQMEESTIREKDW
ncbi:MAG: 4Fe-4S dicluster domain-containing protein [Deltaproteobacteria bacterium]|nr:4Fe-4S dicluster domain-containing protein [Deltaproteobacteria bacterium]